VDIVTWLQELGRSVGDGPRFHARPLYVVVCVVLPVTWGLSVGFLLRAIEKIVGVELGRGGAH
jgi:hypothetical protein